MRQQKYLYVLLMLLAVFAACKGESPTAPPTTTSGGGGGGTTPPTGASLTLTASSTTPQVGSQSIITATVTQNGQPVPNGTAVEFTTVTGASFVETGTTSAIRTTTNGVATVTVTSSSPGPVTVQAVVNNVLKTTVVTFQAAPVDTCPPVCPPEVPTISSITPTFASPAGGEQVVITGKFLKAPVRVFFDFGAGTTPKEAFVVSRTDNQIIVLTPAVDLGTGQTKTATIRVITQAGTASESSVAAAAPFTFQADVLTPTITTVSPASGPIDGGTRITIFGDAFQQPVQVFFGTAEAQVVSVTFKQLVVISPPQRDAGSAPGTATDVRVVNINSNKSVTATGVFRYVQKVVITAAGPTQGPMSGGTRVVIDGQGFNDPIAITIGGFAAQPIKVTPTQVTAITSSIVPAACADVPGPIHITNIDNGDGADGPTFTYKIVRPAIVSVSSQSVQENGSLQIVVANVVGSATKITIGGKSAFLTGATTNATTGLTTFTVQVPGGFTFPQVACTVSGVPGTQNGPLNNQDIVYLSVDTTCTDTLSGFLTITPTNNTCTIPSPPQGVVSPTPPACASTSPLTPSAASGTASATLTVLNTAPSGSQNLNVTSVSLTASTNALFSITPTTASIAPGSSQAFTVTVDPGSAGAFSGTFTFNTNAGTLTGCVSGVAGP